MHRDRIHAPGKEKEWNESFYFSCYDKKNDICIFMRIGLKPNKNEKSMFCFFMMPDNAIIGTKGEEQHENNDLMVKNLQYSCIEPEKMWHLAFSGVMGSPKKDRLHDVSFSFEYESLNDIFDYRTCVTGRKEAIAQRVASEHLEQFGRMTGTLTIDGERYQIDGLGERDHSWGVRDWTAPHMWIWLTCQFSETCALNVTKLVVEEGEVDAGFVHLGRNIPLVSADIDTVYGSDGTPQSFVMSLEDTEGTVHKIDAQVLKKASLPFEGKGGKRSLLHETLAKYTYNGKKGYGIAEYLVRKK
jgi:hypothetical protein